MCDQFMLFLVFTYCALYGIIFPYFGSCIVLLILEKELQEQKRYLDFLFYFPVFFSVLLNGNFLYLIMSLFIARIKWLWCVYIQIILDMNLSLQYSNYLGVRLSFAVPASTFCLQFSCWGFSLLYYQGSFLFLSLESFKFMSIRTIRKTLNQSCMLTSKSLLYCMFRYSEMSDKM